MRKALEGTSGARLVYVHKKSMSRSKVTRIREIAGTLGAEPIDSGGLEDLLG
jgi:hypothetical protein